MTSYTDETVSNLIINKLTKAQFDAISVPSETELYIITDEDGLPSQTGNAGKFLTTNGTTTSWETVSGGGSEEDNLTITKNDSNKIQTVGIINSNTNSGAISPLKLWQGSELEWNQGETTTWNYWQTSVTAIWTASTLPSSANWRSLTYGDGKFVAISYNSDASAYSTDGINWTASTLPSSANWRPLTYGDGKFVAIATGSDKAVYSTDGINWTASTLPSSSFWNSVTYGDGKFVAIAGSYSNKAAYSTDGINWTESTLPSSSFWNSVTYGDGKFVAVGNFSSKAAYSTDGINWTESTLPSSKNWSSVTYGDGKFVAVIYNSDKSAYSTDGINWTESTLPSSANWQAVTYGDGKFVAVAYDSDASAYSIDDINWTASTLPSSAKWQAVTYGDGKFVAVAYDSDASAVFTIQYDKCYILDSTPTTSSQVYSEPETTSTKTITSVGSGTITLSDNLVYNSTQSGNKNTYKTIGTIHPNWLCFINGVGVKMGNTLIASATPITTSITSTSTNAEVPSAKAVYNEVGEIENALNIINSGS